jgi:predicted Zn-dependent protease
MKTTKELGESCSSILDFLKTQKDIGDAQVFVAANKHTLCRLNYTSHIFSNGIEEPKATQNFGIGLSIVFNDGQYGSGSAESSLSSQGAKEALDKARISAVKDPEFYGLPKPEFGERILRDYHDRELADLSDQEFIRIAWDVLRAGLRAFLEKVEPSDAGLIIGGDVQAICERMAVASFTRLEPETDESTMVMASITAMIESKNAKGSGFFAGKTLSELRESGPQAATEAVNSAFATMSGERIESGEHTVVFGPQAVAELVNNLILRGLTAGNIFAEASPFQEKFLQQIASERLSIYDDGANPKFMGAKGITCEGLPTGKTNLIKDGKFVGMLASHYDYQRLLRDPDGARKLGADPEGHIWTFWPRNGFRFSEGAGRQFSKEPSTAGSNIIITSSKLEPLEKLIGRVKKGVYIGRMWYVYPINGQRAGDFTGTVTADSHIIENGKLSRPLKPNAVRINDNIKSLIMKIIGVSDRLKAVNLWGADEAMYASDLLVEGVRLDSIGGSIE